MAKPGFKPNLSLKNPGLSVQQFLPQISFTDPSIFVQLYCGVLVCEKRAGDGVLEPCSARPP